MVYQLLHNLRQYRFLSFLRRMVDQRRISISPHTGGIRNSELVLGTWRNYFYIWLKFYWKTTGGSKIRITDAPVSKNISESPTDQYYAWVYNNKLENRLIIISGCLGTLKDRWNFGHVVLKFITNIIVTFKLDLYSVHIHY